ncbi:MAG: CYTH domain-containing protein [Clostridia bacterium]|nr:CYTH domain-containing protein [Clostridia bacterium]
MSIENELKFLILKEKSLEDILRQLELYNFKMEPSSKKSNFQVDEYFDTRNFDIEKYGGSLRIRKKGEESYITYKKPISSNDKYKSRNEYEIEISPNTTIQQAIKLIEGKFNISIENDVNPILTVENNRHYANIIAPDSSKIEIAIDDLKCTDGTTHKKFDMKNELECEVLSGNPENLKILAAIISEELEGEMPNQISKYSRARKEISEQQSNMSLKEITACYVISSILKSTEFKQLKYKGQIFHNYLKKTETNLDNLENPEYLIKQISKVKREKNYNPGKPKNLEELFLCFFSDIEYPTMENYVSNFLNENYYNNEDLLTNRMSHSQQVSLATGLACKSKNIIISDDERLVTIFSALFHDIGHVPFAHRMEKTLQSIDGNFSHEINGKNVVQRIRSDNAEDISNEIMRKMEGLDESTVKQEVDMAYNSIISAIEEHSRTNFEYRGQGINVQLPREFDKVAYAISDIVDATKEDKNIDIISKKWQEDTISELSVGYEERDNEISGKVQKFTDMIQKKKYGELFTSIVNTIRTNKRPGIDYYEIDTDMWDIINKSIKRVRTLRETNVINNESEKMERFSVMMALLKITENSEPNKSVRNAWQKTLQEITKMNDLDMLEYAKQVLKQVGEKKIEDVFHIDRKQIQSLNDTNKEIKLSGDVELSELVNELDISNATMERIKIVDKYYKNNMPNSTLCIRTIIGTDKKILIVKTSHDKPGMSYISRSKQVVEGTIEDSTDELIFEYNLKYREALKELGEEFLVKKNRLIIQGKTPNGELCIVQDDSLAENKSSEVELPKGIEIKMLQGDIEEVKIKIKELLRKKLGEKYKKAYVKKSTHKIAEEMLNSSQERDLG